MNNVSNYIIPCRAQCVHCKGELRESYRAAIPRHFSKYLLAEFEVTRTTKVLRHRFMDHGSTVMKSTIQVAVDNSDRSLLLLLLLL